MTRPGGGGLRRALGRPALTVESVVLAFFLPTRSILVSLLVVAAAFLFLAVRAAARRASGS